jgi:PAS domain S-box-containing protein
MIRPPRPAAAVWLALLTLALPALAHAAQDESTARLSIIFGTIVGALIIGALLFQLSQRSSKAKFKEDDERGELVKTQESAAAVSDVSPAILKELNRLPVSVESRQQVARSVAEIVSKTVATRVETVRREMGQEFEKVIEGERKEKAVVQAKYQETLVEKKQTVSVLESIAEGLVVVNNKGEVVMMNPAAERLLAVSQKERIGKPLTEGIRDEALISLAQGSGEDRDIVLNAKQDTTKKVLRASNAMITDEDGKTVGMVAMLSDVTKQRELDQLKSEFVSKVSHELRTPIVAMQHALSILVDEVAGPLGEEQKKFASLTQRNLQRLNVLINDLLDLSKLEAKKMELRLESASLIPVIQGVCDTLDAWAKAKAINISKRLPSDLPNVTCDPHRVTQVITNLMGNAIKFTPKQGRITVEARVIDGGRAVEVSVADNGVGISKDDLPKLFNKFQQVGERTASDISGTGLGLAISKEIVELHKGRIWAESDPSVRQGTRFAFTVPLDGAEEPAAGS